ncbi:MAG: sensor histidine kinase [Bacteroidota bacterium]
MKNRTGQILLHVTGCIAFLSLPVLLSPDVSWNFHFVQVSAFREDFITYTLLLLFFYLNYFSLLPKLYFKQKFIYYFGCVIISYAVIAWLPHLIEPGNHIRHFQPGANGGTISRRQPLITNERLPDLQSSQNVNTQPDDNNLQPGNSRRDMRPLPDNNHQPGVRPDRRPPNSNMRLPPGSPPGFLRTIPNFEYLFQFIVVLILSAMIRINNRLKQSEKEKVNAELSYLKAQINPHFLFNTLNSIYSSAIDENADNTASAVVKLSGMMRYVISEAHHQYVPLEKELSYISDYIELQKIRLGNTVHLIYHVTGITAGKQIAPLILISFIENAFKHGVNPEEHSNIEIEIDVYEQTLHLSVMNNKVRNVNGDSFKNNIGLENTRNRLQLLYPSHHELVIKDDEKEFLVLLKMNLQ